MNDTMTTPSTGNRMQWNSPVLVIAAIVAAFIMGALAYSRFLRPQQQAVSSPQESTVIQESIIGADLDENKVREVTETILDFENDFLTTATMRTSYGGGLEELTETDEGLEFLISRGDIANVFFIPNDLLDKTKFRLITATGDVAEVPYTNLKPGYGITITIVTNMIAGETGNQEVTVEATVN